MGDHLNLSQCSRGSEETREQTIERNVNLDHLRAILRTVSLSTRQHMEQGLSMIIHYMQNVKSQEMMRYNVVALFSLSLEERDFALKAGIVYGAVYTMILGEVTVGTHLIHKIKQELKKENFSNGDKNSFLNGVFFLSELYYHMRSGDEPIAVLGEELLKCLLWLLPGEECEHEILATGLITNGAALKKGHPECYRKLLIEIRVTLLGRYISIVSKSWLLLTLDTDNLNFISLPDDLEHHYRLFIGNSGFQKLKRMRWSPKVNSEEKPEDASGITSIVELSQEEQLVTSQTENRCSEKTANKEGPSKKLSPIKHSIHSIPEAEPSTSRSRLTKKLRALDRAIFPKKQRSVNESDSRNDSSVVNLNVALWDSDS